VAPPGKRAKNAHSISLPLLLQHYLVAVATSLDKLENKVQVHHLHLNQSSISGVIRLNMQGFWPCRT